jgi:hypothetical protein
MSGQPAAGGRSQSAVAALWGAACVLPMQLGQMEARFVLPIGFSIFPLNTPICILLSCDSALERAVRFLPGQGKAFCVFN